MHSDPKMAVKKVGIWSICKGPSLNGAIPLLQFLTPYACHHRYIWKITQITIFVTPSLSFGMTLFMDDPQVAYAIVILQHKLHTCL